MVGLKLDLKNAGITEKSILKYSKEVEKIHTELHEKKDDENEFLGWLDLPSDYDKKEVEMLNHKYCIINIHQENNTTELRIVSKQKPTVNAVNIEPNLEDLYLAYFQDNEK